MTPEVMAALASRGINDPEAGFSEHWNMRRPRITDDAKVLRADAIPDRTWRELDSTVIRIGAELTPAHNSLPSRSGHRTPSARSRCRCLESVGSRARVRKPEC